VTSAHVIYIPMAMLVGMFVGFIFGTRAARNAFDLQKKRDEERAAVREARAARKAAAGAGAGATDEEGGGS
jgi:hypothetical protein